ncbi:MAG: response regulator transcription factor [Pseudomonadota bacterium]
MSDKITVVLADDHPMVLDGVRSCLEGFDHIEVVGAATDGREAIALIERLAPDIALMDVNMPGCSGLKATAELAERGAATRIVILSMHDSSEYIDHAMTQGARGYVLKSAPAEAIVEAIETAYRGEIYKCAHAAAAIDARNGEAGPLTKRERSILTMVAEGAANKDVARALDISVRTVETHRKNIKRKLGIDTTAGLTAFAMENGLV